ncbi:MAG: hypothetical protein KAW93_09185 [Methanogenium sp.]|nr:hypothetical protein [Methanogenium sp.]
MTNQKDVIDDELRQFLRHEINEASNRLDDLKWELRRTDNHPSRGWIAGQQRELQNAAKRLGILRRKLEKINNPSAGGDINE